LGIDAGSTTVSLAVLSPEKDVLKTAYAFHNGKVKETILLLSKDLPVDKIGSIGVTKSTPDIIQFSQRYDNRVSFITAAKQKHPKLKSLLIISGEKFGIAHFDDKGDYLNFRSNSSCAAGTGSFLDQQAKRLHLKDIEEFCRIACRNEGDIPKIASRCAVFAKTDLIHAQQEGFSLEAICDGIAFGLAKNIIDTLVTTITPSSPLVIAGGVSKNMAVMRHIADMLSIEATIDSDSHVYGAIGAALSRQCDDGSGLPIRFDKLEELISHGVKSRSYSYQPLELTLSQYPDFACLDRYEFSSSVSPGMPPVETDIYEEQPASGVLNAYLGVDIGSTSTKAVLLNESGRVVAGFYTRTSGRPVEAVQIIFEAIHHYSTQKQLSLNILGTGTTGSGRKFVGEIVGADIILNEITAHARAAFELDSEVDTIIEIGGQDSKFTTMKNGMVTFSIMNNVCAAGTGSYIEEQAKKLDCPLSDFSQRAEGIASPITSDKCTVFMERDLNHYLSEGYSVDECLASVLHSVRDNYLTKVSIESNIGNRIFFQGATAKNRALVAAFEQKLRKPIMVSKFCHLTGALGVALHLADEKKPVSRFRGIDLHKQKIPVNTEVCELCTNHCKIKTAVINGKMVAFGFLCDRDYETQKFVKEKTLGFDLIKTREKLQFRQPKQEFEEEFTIGLPLALHLFDEIDFWQKFFNLLSIKTVTSEKHRHAVKEGKKLTGAEFCAPVTALHSHVQYLAERVDYIFLPDYLEIKPQRSNERRHYCYYTQYAPALITGINSISSQVRILNPTLRTIKGVLHTKYQLHKMLNRICNRNIGFLKLSAAFDKALDHHNANQEKLRHIFIRETRSSNTINVVLLGRPYTILSPDMNSRIPEIFDRLGVNAFFQDMLTISPKDLGAIDPLLKLVHWNYAAKIFESAEYVAKTDNLYPVLVTSFKCTPDAFVIDNFKKILDSRKKPYLILQLDEHDSNVGYETRIEAGIRSFKNHASAGRLNTLDTYRYKNPVFLTGQNSIKDKTLILPNFDYYPCKLLEASLRKAGINTILAEETEDSIKRSISLNKGECLPIAMMTQAAIDTVIKHDLDPEKTAIWTIESNISCNLGVIPHFMRNILDSFGNGMEKVSVYAGEITFVDISFRITYNAYFAFMFGGFLKKMGCKTRPYELEKGTTDRIIAKSLDIFYDAFLNDTSKEDAVETVVRMFEAIKVARTFRPQVAIFGDLYVRDNDVVNQNLINTIEENDGEAITTPYNEYMRMIADPFIQKWFREGFYSSAATAQVLAKTFPILEKRYYSVFNRYIKEKDHNFIKNPEELLSQFNVKMLHTGESLETILKIFTFINNYPDICLFVQTSPSLCCPSLITEAMSSKIEELTGIPVVNIEYDGTGGSKNNDIIPYLKYPRKRGEWVFLRAL